LETHLGLAAGSLGFRAITPVFDGADEKEIEAELARGCWWSKPGRCDQRAWIGLRSKSTRWKIWPTTPKLACFTSAPGSTP